MELRKVLDYLEDRLEASEVAEVGAALRGRPEGRALLERIRKLAKPDGRIDWSRSAVEVERHVRGMQPWTGPFTELHQLGRPAQRIQIQSVRVVARESSGNERPGDVLLVDPDEILVRCGDNAVQIIQLQPDGKRPMAAPEFLRGRKLSRGDRFE